MAANIWDVEVGLIHFKIFLKYYNNRQYEYEIISYYFVILLILYHRRCAMESDILAMIDAFMFA